MVDFTLLFHFGDCRKDTFFASTGFISKTVCSTTGGIAKCFRLGAVGSRLMRGGIRLRLRLRDVHGTLVRTARSDDNMRRLGRRTLTKCSVFGTDIVGGDIARTSGCVALSGKRTSNVHDRVKIMGKDNIINVICLASPRCSVIVPMLGSGDDVDYGVGQDSCFNFLG